MSQHSAPVAFLSGWLVRLETHCLGGGRYWGRWEIADIGVLIVFRRAGVVVQTKIAVLQSKRLYPVEAHTTAEDHRLDYIVGFGRLLPAEQEYKSAVKPRTFSFVKDSRFRALEYGGGQYQATLEYEKDTYPIEASGAKTQIGSRPVGARVVSAVALDAYLNGQIGAGDNPAFDQVFRSPASPSSTPWPLEYFIADLVLSCKEGHVAGVNPMSDEALYTVFNRRSGPISAAIAITIDAPAQVEAEVLLRSS